MKQKTLPGSLLHTHCETVCSEESDGGTQQQRALFSLCAPIDSSYLKRGDYTNAYTFINQVLQVLTAFDEQFDFLGLHP